MTDASKFNGRPFVIDFQCPMCPNTRIEVYTGPKVVGYICDACGHGWTNPRRGKGKGQKRGPSKSNSKRSESRKEKRARAALKDAERRIMGKPKWESTSTLANL